MFQLLRVRRAYLPIVTLFVTSFLVACGGGSRSSTLQVIANTSSFAAGTTTQLTATETDLLGNTSDVTFKTTWGTSNGNIATVSSTGLVTGVTAGSATITGTMQTLTGAVGLSIGAPGVSSIVISPQNMTVTSGATQTYTATAIYANSTRGVLTSGVTWSVLPKTVATISSNGLLKALAPGPFVVSASTGSAAGPLATTTSGAVTNATLASIAIMPSTSRLAGASTQQFTATGTYSDHSTGSLTQSVTWTTNNSAVLAIDANGLATSQAVSLATPVTVTASYATSAAELSASATVQVVPSAGLTSLVVQPTSSSIANGTAEPHTATAFYADGSQRDVSKVVTWSVVPASNGANTNLRPVSAVAGHLQSVHADQSTGHVDTTNILDITQAGTDTATSPGTGTIEASLGSTTSQSTVIVTPATIQSLAIRATKDLFPIGSTQPVQLIGTFSDGTTQDLSLTASWQSSDPTIATIDQTGLATGVKAGAVTFSSSFGGLHASTIGFQVLPGTLLSTIIDVDYPSEPVGLSEQLRLLGTYSDGTTHDLTQLATWSTVDASIFPVNSTGLAYALKAGQTQIVGTVFGKEAITTILAIPVTLNSITVFSNSPSFALGTTLDMTGVGNFAGGIQADMTDPCIWSSSDPTVLTVSASGKVKGGKAGTATVTCVSLGLSGSADLTVTAATLTRLAIDPATSQLAALTGREYTAWGWFSDGTLQDVSNDVTWNTSDNDTASIDTEGNAIGMKAGVVQITANMAGLAASVPLTVTNAYLTSVAVTPGNSELPYLLNKQFNLIGTFSDGTTEDLTNDAVWSAPTPLIVAVTLKGEVLGVSPGTGPIAAQYGNFSASTPVNVTNVTLTSLALTPLSTVMRVGDQQVITETATFSDGSTLDLGDINAFTSSSDSNVASYVTTTYQYDNIVFGVGVGNATITAQFGDKSVSTTKFQVLSNVISSVAITPSNPTITAGSTTQFTDTATYSDGSTGSLNSTTVWTSSNPAILSIDANGLATAHTTNAPASVTLTGVAGPATSTVIVTVNPISTGPVATLASILVVPTSTHAAAGTTAQFSAVGIYSDGSTADLTSAVTWSSSHASEATINSAGVASAIAPGTVSVTATSSVNTGALQGHATLVVTGATLASVGISPGGASFPFGTVQPFKLTGYFSDGSTQNLSAAATWASSANGVSTISPTGIATGVSAGAVQFTASFGSLSASTSAQVTSATLVSATLTPATSSFPAGITQQLLAIGTYSDGSTHDVSSQATFTSGSPAVLNVIAAGTQAGLTRGLTPGAAEVTAVIGGSGGGQTATTQSITVTAATLVSLEVTPNTPSFANGTTQPFTAVATFSDGTERDVTSQAFWSSSNPQILTIDAAGLASSDGTGTASITATLNGVSATTGNATVTPATLTALTLSPTSARIAKHTSEQFIVTGTFTDGTTQNLSATVNWSSSSAAVAFISATGLATGTGPGTATLTATYQGGTAQAITVLTTSFQVTSATLVSLAFNPAAPSVAAGSGAQVTVTGTFSDSTTQNLSASTTYSSSNPAVVTISDTGIISGISPGTSEITATVDGQTSNFLVTVTNATLNSIVITPTNPAAFAKGTTEQFTATGNYSDGSTQNLSSIVSWLSSNTAVFTINNNGLATGTGIGSATLTADYQGQSTTTSAIQVTPATLASIALTPANPTIATSGTQQFSATGTFTDGSTEDVSTSATWTSSNASAATIDGNGLATAHSIGSATITAQSGTFSNSTTLTVSTGPGTPATLVSIAITPQNAALVAGNTLQYTATGTYSDGSARNLSSLVTWNSSSIATATINAAGSVSTLAAGTTTIGAALGSTASSTSLSVSVAPVTLQSIAITPATASVAKGSPQQFTATGSYSDGTTQNITTQVTWQSASPSTASISTSGLATTTAASTTQVSATLAGQSATVTLTVGPAALVSLAVTPHAVTLANGTDQQFKAIGTMTDGGTQDLTTSVAWASNNASVATITNSGNSSTRPPGFALTHTAGSATITAQSGTISATAATTVTSATALSIQLTPAAVALAASQTQQLLATATFSDGTSQDVTSSVAYTVLNANVVSVNLAGLLTAIGPGTSTVTAGLGTTTGIMVATVSNGTLTSIAITPSDPSLPVGLSQQLTATGTFSDGSTENLTNSATWSTSNISVAPVSTTGNVLIASTGAAIITAANGSVSGETTVTGTSAIVNSIGVSPASVTLAVGQTQQFAATASLSDGTQQTVTASAHWGVSNPADATISNTSGSNGFMTASAAGTINVIATANSNTGTAAVSIQPATLTSLVITPNPISLPAGASQTLSVTGSYSNGSTADVTASSSFSSSNASTAAVSASGLVQGVSSGSTTITANVGTISNTDAVTVTSATLTSIAITPASPNVALGLTKQLTAIGTYSDNTTANITSQVQWASTSPSIATISGSGLVTTIATGTSTIIATLNATAATTVFTVNTASLQSIGVTAAQNNFPLGLSLQLKAIGNYSDGTTQDLTSAVAWSSQTPAVAVVSATGLATGHTTGTFNAVATLGSVSGSFIVTVTSAVLQSISLSPASVNEIDLLGAPIQFTATGHYSNGTTQDLTNSVLWAISGTLGTISASGQLSVIAIGSGNVTATYGTIVGSATVSIIGL